MGDYSIPGALLVYIFNHPLGICMCVSRAVQAGFKRLHSVKECRYVVVLIKSTQKVLFQLARAQTDKQVRYDGDTNIDTDEIKSKA